MMMMRFLLPLLLGPLLAGAATIEINKPVSASLKPDILYWDCDDGVVGTSSPGPVVDRSGNGYEPYLLPRGNAPTYIKGRFGTALLLSRAERFASYLRWNSGANKTEPEAIRRLQLNTPDFTLGGWLRVDRAAHPGQADSIEIFRASQGQDVLWQLFLIKGADDQWRMRLDWHGARHLSTAVIDWLELARWHHIAVSMGKDEDDELRVYFWVDGAPLGEGVDVDLAKLPTGQEERKGSFLLANGNRLNGALDDFFITSGVHQFKP